MSFLSDVRVNYSVRKKRCPLLTRRDGARAKPGTFWVNYCSPRQMQYDTDHGLMVCVVLRGCCFYHAFQVSNFFCSGLVETIAARTS